MQSIKKFVGTVFEKINKVSVFGQNWAQKGPKKGHPMHQSASDLHHSIGIEIIGADFEKIDKVFVTGIHTYQSDVIGPPAGVQLAVFQA